MMTFTDLKTRVERTTETSSNMPLKVFTLVVYESPTVTYHQRIVEAVFKDWRLFHTYFTVLYYTYVMIHVQA